MSYMSSAKAAAVLLFSLILWSTTAMARGSSGESPNCGGEHRVGDHITCYVRFASKADFKDLQVVFNLPREDKPRKRGTQINFILRDTVKVSPRVYSVSGVLPDCVPGTYILAAIVARNSKHYQEYLNLPGLEIGVENDSGDKAAIPSANQVLHSVDIAPSDPKTSPPITKDVVPQFVKTPPPDPSVFPAIIKITPAPAAPAVDLVTWLTRFLRKQDSCGGKHKQGETVTCRIQFGGNPRFQMVAMSFIRDEARTTFSQSQQCRGFGVGIAPGSPPLAVGMYEVKTKIPMCSSGKYKITAVTAFGYSNGDKTNVYVKNYGNGFDFKSAIVLKVQDVAQSQFPAIVAVGN